MSRSPGRRGASPRRGTAARTLPRAAKPVVAKPQRSVSGAQSAARGAAPFRLPRAPKGRRPQFFAESGVDQLFGIVTALTGELSAACERIETLERLLERRGALVRAEIESYAADEEETAARTVAREALIERVFQVLEDYASPDLPTTD